MADKTSIKSKKVAGKAAASQAAAKPVLLAGGNPQIAKGYGDASKSWNSSHGTRGCSLDALKTTGGAGLFYCFAAN
jgi:hypothetical protein